MLFLLFIESLQLSLIRVRSWCNKKNKVLFLLLSLTNPWREPAPLHMNPHCSASSSSATAMASSGLQEFRILDPSKGRRWGEVARLLPNPGEAMITFHSNSERRLATALLEKTRKKRSLVSRMCGCFSHCVLLLCPPGSRGKRPGPVLIPLASPIMLLFKQPTGFREVCNLGRGTSGPTPACQPLISHPLP